MVRRQVELIVSCPGFPERRLILKHGVLQVGRAEDNGLVLRDIAVSRRHASIAIDPDRVVVKDLGSGNGTYINGEPIKQQTLQEGDEVFIDPFTLRFDFVPVPQQSGSTQPVNISSAPPAQREASKGARLETLGGHGLHGHYDLASSGTRLGRAEQRDIVVSDPSASRLHAEIYASGGKWYVRDSGSANGTFVNNSRVREQVLAHGDRIRIGNSEFRFLLTDSDSLPGFAPDRVVEGGSPLSQPDANEDARFAMQDSRKAADADPSGQTRGKPHDMGGDLAAPGGDPLLAMGSGPSSFAGELADLPTRVGGEPPAKEQSDRPPPSPVEVPPGSQGGLAPVPPVPSVPAPSSGSAVTDVPVGPGLQQAAPGGFGAVEMDVRAARPRRGRRLKTNRAVGSAGGSFMERHIRKLIVVVGLLPVVLVVFKVARDSASDVTAPTASTSSRAVHGEQSQTAAPQQDISAGQSAGVDSLLDEGNQLFRSQKYLEAIEKYAQVQRMDPGNTTAAKMGYHACEFFVIKSLRAEVVRRSTSDSERRAAYDKAIQDAQAVIDRKSGVSIADALSGLEAVQTFFPDDDRLKSMLEKIRAIRRSRNVAAQRRKLEAHAADIAVLFDRGQREFAMGEYVKAIGIFEEVLSADTQKSTEFYWKAEEQIRQAKARLNEQARVFYRAGLTALKAQDYLAARTRFRETLKKDPYYSSARRRLEEVQQELDQLARKAWTEAEIYEGSNQTDLAVGRYRKVIEYCESASSSLAVKAQKHIDALLR